MLTPTRPRAMSRVLAGLLAALPFASAATSQAPATPLAVPGRGAPAVRPTRVDDSLVVDGVMDDAAWQGAARLTGFSQYQPVDQRPAVDSTEVRVVYTAQAIYFGIIATASDPAAVRATVSKRDNVTNDDRVAIYLDTFNDRRRAYLFGANALGVQLDGVRTEGAVSAGSMFGGSVDFAPDFQFVTSGRRTATGYVIEMKIPFRSIRFSAEQVQTWGIQVLRSIPSRTAEDTWTDAQRGASSFLAQSGTLTGIERVNRGVVTDVQPFVTGASVGSENGAGHFTRGPMRGDAGVNLRLGFPSLAIDGTINPDFSQVEADVGLVTANERFALFVPERRPFFLEGIELFATPNQLVYSRTIDNPIAGLKVTGKTGRLGVALMSAVDELSDHYDAVNIARLRRDYGENSVAGITVTDRRGGGVTNTVVAADTRYVFQKLYYAQVQYGSSFTSRTGSSTQAPIWNAELDRTGRRWGFNLATTGVGDDFETGAGFVPRRAFQQAHMFHRVSFLGTETSLFQNISIFAGPSRIWRYGSFSRAGMIEGNEQVGTFITMRGGWGLSPSVQRDFVTVDSGIYQRDGSVQLVAQKPGARLSNLWTVSGSLTTPVFRRVNGSLSVEAGDVPLFGEGIAGTVRRATAAVTLRPTPGTRLEGMLTHARLARANGTMYARVTIPRLKAEYQPSRTVFFRVVTQFNGNRSDAVRNTITGQPITGSDGGPSQPTHTRSLSTDWLVQYEPTPGTTAFIGYGDRWGSRGTVLDTRLLRESDGIFIKLSYLFRH
ncbi:MAG: carbohydrate binding family 9 domain-containing protein [Gemmatimonadaceae bacterium]|nr:carbohydrate binding family 9 domain-containing protein [Gemmatimonadaceae bacterium]